MDQSSNRYVSNEINTNIFRSWTNSWEIPSGVPVKANTWYHVTNTYDGTLPKSTLTVKKSLPRFAKVSGTRSGTDSLVRYRQIV